MLKTSPQRFPRSGRKYGWVPDARAVQFWLPLLASGTWVLWPALAAAQLMPADEFRLRVGIAVASNVIAHEEHYEASHTRGISIGLEWERTRGAYGLRGSGEVVLGSTVSMRDVRPSCDAAPSGAVDPCRSKGTPAIGVARLLAGPTARVGRLHGALQGGVRADLGWDHACPLLDAACLALMDYPWPTVGLLGKGALGIEFALRRRRIQLEIADHVSRRPSGTLHEVGVSVAVPW